MFTYNGREMPFVLHLKIIIFIKYHAYWKGYQKKLYKLYPKLRLIGAVLSTYTSYKYVENL